ncbi:MAG: hypothetical protein M3R70_09810 [Actinomycetota bacterium]|nr:hypothetical protein [Actinomycetota bacterium]
MRSRLTKAGAALVAIAALAVGGSALASAGSNGKQPAKPAAAKSQKAKQAAKPAAAKSQKAKPAAAASKNEAASPDTDNVQEGDQSAPDNASEKADSASEPAESASESASESGPSDGPGGYADTSPNADTQQEGEH